jgi:tetratricopeptide (TPR) repeat protein
LTESPRNGVRAWEDVVIIPTYPEQAADKNPMFLEKRVYQGSSGKVYPNPFTDRVSNEKFDKAYKAVFLENEYLHLMILPEIGGRIHVGQDRTNGYDFFYRQHVIKPALVGLLGPWISGGVEFNWPQHHRPSTFMPVEHAIEQSEDGSVTVWLGEHEPMQRMKGMVGICLHPNKAYIEAKVRLHNRTPFAQTFLWWANVGIRVHDEYQAFFPPDVTYVADHAKRAMSSFPVARNFYYGVDYRKGVDISWYKNIPVPTSYMVIESKYDFFGGYDHRQQAGIVHFADHHIAPGKKLWTWGNAEFGYAWDRNLTDSDGPYIELMAGVFTDNQPDFSWLHPCESRAWSQFWYPIQQIGPARNANRHAAVSLTQEGDRIRVGICVTESFKQAKLAVTANGKQVLEEVTDFLPGAPIIRELAGEGKPHVRLFTNEGKELIHCTLDEVPERTQLPNPATEPKAPKEIPSNDELYVTGLHLEQYRHATRYPEPYWEEALRRDPLDNRCNTALGLLRLRRGQFAEAERHFRRAIERQTLRNPNPADAEAFYYLGVTLQYQERFEEAYAAFYKATWNHAWQAAAYYHLAEIECRRNEFRRALEQLGQSLESSPTNLMARNLKAAVLRKLGLFAEAQECAKATAAADPLDVWSRNELRLSSRSKTDLARETGSPAGTRTKVQLCLDLAFDYSRAGFWAEATDVLSREVAQSGQQVHPMVFYSLAYCADRMGDRNRVSTYRAEATKASPDYCFPAGIEEMIVVEAALAADAADAKGHYYLGNLFYDKKRYEEAIREWESGAGLDPTFAIPWRNLGIAYFNVHKDSERALKAYETALQANPADARLLYELDQLRKRVGVSASQRLAQLEGHPDPLSQRDDLMTELVTLYNQTSQSRKALEILAGRRFNPWEGGEGLVSGQYVWANLLIGRSFLENRNWQKALEHFSAAREYPHNLGEGKHLLTRETHLDYFSGVALSYAGRFEEARGFWARGAGDESLISWMSYFRAVSLQALGRNADASRVLEDMRAFATQQIKAEVKIDYFATSLPNLLLFEDDLQKRNQVECLFLMALVELGERHSERASALLSQVLALDCNHLAAQEELRALTWTAGRQEATVDR